NEAEGYDVIEVVEDGVKRFLKRFFTTTKTQTIATVIESSYSDEVTEKQQPIVTEVIENKRDEFNVVEAVGSGVKGFFGLFGKKSE
ncbi:hypothetical protein HK096_007486, partial [Nowakowskiella sp. JEL0078]